MSSNHFLRSETAKRYERYRPAVHAVIYERLAAAGVSGPFRRAIDIACGTGHSTEPLLALAETVEAIDASPEMIAIARSKGLNARVASYDALLPAAYDLVSVCMAYQWFDRAAAVQALERASSPGATWLIYNFSLHGHASEDHFNHWYRGWYLETYPAPRRAAVEFIPSLTEPDLELIARGTGSLRVAFSRERLIGYLTTQSNVERALGHGASLEDIESILHARMPVVAAEDSYVYGFTYSICRCGRANP
jgi:SAM-dependent methyltransferase